MKILDVPQSGSIAGVTSSRNRYGQYRRTRAIPVNPNTSVQTANRNLFGSVASAWKNLTTAQQDLWNSYAVTMPKQDPLGQTIYWSGFQSFVECAMIRQSVGLTQPTVPPGDVTLPALTILFVCDFSAQTVIGTFTPTPVPAATHLIIEATTTVSHGVSFVGPSEFRRLGYEIAAAASPTDMTAEYAAVWGAVGPVGQRIFFRARLLDDTGCAGPWVFTRARIVA